MPAEVARVMLKPNSFFEYNPTLDIPPSSQAFNQSVLYDDTKASLNGYANGYANGHANGHADGVNGATEVMAGSSLNGSCCGKT